MTASEFADVFAALALQLQNKDADAAMIRAYFVAMDDLPLPLVKAAAKRMSRTATWFPKTSEWIDVVEAIRRERREHLKAIQRRSLEPMCRACDDTGLEIRNNRAFRCDCQELRQREIDGLRPLPKMLPEPQPKQLEDGRRKLAKLLEKGFGRKTSEVYLNGEDTKQRKRRRQL